jgi:chemotaxis protein methyltransferase CheR
VNPFDYDYLRALLKERSGLSLSNEKQYLVESRLLPVVRKAGLNGLSDLVAKLKAPGATMLTTRVVEAMTTNESFFFRDKTPFEHFRDTIMPALLQARANSRRIRIWCAAAAAGQEPYSLAICLREMADKLAGWRVDLLATDLSGEILERAKSGIYSQFEAQRGLPIQMLLKYFTQVGDRWQVNAELRDMVRFRPINLLYDFAPLGTFDVVFCRNVLIYFDAPTKAATFKRLSRVVASDGYLLLGAAETVIGLTDMFKPVPDKRGLYAPVPLARGAGGTGFTWGGRSA